MSKYKLYVAAFFLVITSLLSFQASANKHEPVVLISGTASDENAMALLEKYLVKENFQVYKTSLVHLGFAPTDTSVEKINEFIKHVLLETGANEVDLVGWSQGAHIGRRYLQQRGTSKVDTLVMLGSPTYQWSWMTFLHALTGGHCLGLGNCIDQNIDSQVLFEMNGGDDMPQGVKVFNIWSNFDYIVTPAGAVSRLIDGNTGTQFSVQDVCPWRWTGHFGLVYDKVVHRIVNTALKGRQASWGWDCFTPPVFL